MGEKREAPGQPAGALGPISENSRSRGKVSWALDGR